MKVSVVMSVFNAEKFLREAIFSVLGQSFSDFEFIIIDDHSTDQSLKIIKKIKDKRIKIIKNNKQLGMARSLNRGIERAAGEFIARMDADDLCHQDRFKRQFYYLKKNKNVAFCGSWVNLINKTGEKIGEKRNPSNYAEIIKIIMFSNPFIHPSVMIRKKVLDKVGFYDPNLECAEDYDLFLRIAKCYRATNLPFFLLNYRVSAYSISFRQYKKMEKNALKARWKAIWQYGYSRKNLVYLIRPLISSFFPQNIKQVYYRKTFKF